MKKYFVTYYYLLFLHYYAFSHAYGLKYRVLYCHCLYKLEIL